MLVLSRKIQESVVVGGAGGFVHMLKVTVLEVKGGTVKLGFDAEDNVPIHRWEVWERIFANKRPESPGKSPRRRVKDSK